MQTKNIINTSLGNIFEWYDYGLFAIYAPLFSKIFFPAHMNYPNIINVFSIFAIGFLCRPLGALLFGYLGDKRGRAKTLRLSILLIAFPTFIIGLLPTFSMIGFYATIFLLCVRIWQGICIGGEYSGCLLYLTEIAPRRKRALFSAFGTISANVGILVSITIAFILQNTFSIDNLETWGWRIPYLFGGIFALVIFINRLYLTETIPFKVLTHKNLIVADPIKIMFKKNYMTLLRLIGMCCMGSTFYCFCVIFLPYLLENEGNFTNNLTLLLTSIFLICMVAFIPLGAYFCDKVGRKPMLLFNVAFIITILFINFYLSNSYNASLLIFVYILFSLGSAFEQSATPVAIIENLPTNVRYTTLSFAYNVANGIFGGTLPFICQWLWSQTSMLGPTLYLVAMAIITGMIVFFFINETSHDSLIY